MLDAMAGPDRREPLAQPGNDGFRAAAEAPVVPRRVAFSPDLGITPVDAEIARVAEAAARTFQDLGAEVEIAHPDMTGAHEAFQTLRGLGFATGHWDHYANHRDQLKPDIVWNIEHGLGLTPEAIGRATRIRGRLVAETLRFFETYDLLITPTAIVPPFGVDERTVTACAGVEFENYIEWLAIVFAITLTSAPALSMPGGRTASGLPVGIQLVGPLRGEARLLSHAAALEAALGLDLGPVDPR